MLTNQEIQVWLTGQVDGHTRGREGVGGWRYRAVGNRSLHQCVAAIGVWQIVQFAIDRAEWIVIVKHIKASGLNNSRYMRRALARDLVASGLDPAQFPKLMQDHDRP